MSNALLPCVCVGGGGPGNPPPLNTPLRQVDRQVVPHGKQLGPKASGGLKTITYIVIELKVVINFLQTN